MDFRKKISFCIHFLKKIHSQIDSINSIAYPESPKVTYMFIHDEGVNPLADYFGVKNILQFQQFVVSKKLCNSLCLL